MELDFCWLKCDQPGNPHYPFTGEFKVMACREHRKSMYYHAWLDLRERLEDMGLVDTLGHPT